MAGVGSVIAGYRVERVLGTGGMGTVYLVANPELPRRDALKVLSAGLSRDPKFRSRFIREADVASQLDHPNIVSIYRRGATADGLLWIAMQFVDGVNADEAARAAGRMEPQRAIHIVGEVGKALDYAHRRGVVHRDVKPANMLLSGPVGPEERVLLGDFGIARALDDVGLTGTGGVLATVSYAAPEVIAGGRVDARSDLYSLGCTLFRLLTGRSPFEGPQASVMMAHLHSPPPRVSEVAPWLPPTLNGVLAKALAKDPAQRFASGAELAGAAAAALHQPGPDPRTAVQPWQQQMQPFTGPMGAPARRNRAGLIVAALAAVVLLVAAGVTAVVLAGGSGSSDSASTSEPTTTTAPATTTSASEASTSPSPTSTPGGTRVPVPATALTSLLLSPADMSTTLSSPPLTVINDETRMWSGTIVDKDCNSVVIVNSQADYAGSGYTAIHWQGLKDNPDDWSWDVGQTVVSFPRADDAANYVAHATDIWKKCANRTVNVRPSQDTAAADTLWKIGPVSDGGGILSTTRIPDAGGNWMCQEAMSSRNNIVIRVWLCHGDADMLLVRKLVDAIGAKVDAQA